MKPPLILASQSPRRSELLALLGVPFTIIPAHIAEIPLRNELPEDFVVRVAAEKGAEVASRVCESVVLSADTVVTIDGLILGKPADEDDACRMLRRLSGRRHVVYTAVCIMDQPHASHMQGLERTDVWFNAMSDTQIRGYVRREDILDKAGAYAIQGFAGVYIEKIEGNYSNVMGLPLPLVHELLSRAGFYF